MSAAVQVPIGDLSPGQLLAERFEIIREIGRGGHSVVYLARDHTVGNEVAIKILVPSPLTAREARIRMRREVQAVRGLRHPNVVGVHDFAEEGTLGFVVMDYLPGGDLAAAIEARGPLPVDHVATIATELGAGLGAAHRAGILHRDIKPANVLLDGQGRALLSDFGSARLDQDGTASATGRMVGTVQYLAPEVWAGQRADARSDLYALGLTLYQALTGQVPEGPAPHLPPVARPNGFRPKLVRQDVPDWLDALVGRATAADPSHRFASAERFLAHLSDRVAGADHGGPERRRLPATLWVVVAGVVLAGAMAASTSWHFLWATPLVAILLVRAARREISAQPSSGDILLHREWPLAGTPAQVATTLEGTARGLLTDILVVAQRVVDHAPTTSLRARWKDQLGPVVDAAVGAAADLARVDDTLQRLERDAAGRRAIPTRWWETVADLEATRDGLSTALLEVVATLSRAERAGLENFAGAKALLADELNVLSVDVDQRIAATRDLEELGVRG